MPLNLIETSIANLIIIGLVVASQRQRKNKRIFGIFVDYN